MSGKPKARSEPQASEVEREVSGPRGQRASSSSRSESQEAPRRRFELDDRGFDEVPRKYRKYYRRWEGPGDALAPNEVLCPVCKVVIRSTRELREGDRIYCMACMTRLRVVRANGRLEGHVEY